MPISLQRPPPGALANGVLPTKYDSKWQSYTGLTVEQRTAFQSFPQALILYARQRAFQAECSGVSVTFTPTGSSTAVTIPLATDHSGKVDTIGLRQAVDDGLITSAAFLDAAGNPQTVDVAGAKAVHQGMLAFIAGLKAACVQAISDINATPPTITTWKAIDALYATLAPNSPSAKNPSQT